MKRLIKITVTQKLLEIDSDSYKGEIGKEVTTENYQWSDNKRDAIGKAMAEYLNIGLDNPHPTIKRSLLEVKETSMKIKFTDGETTNIVGFSFIAK